MAEIKNNVVDNTNLTNHQGDYNGTNSEYWISQINAGGKVYDIATHHNITFRDGNGGATTVWNGLTDIEVVIPTIKDIVQSPIEFAGTVDKNGNISWNTGFGTTPKQGNLLFVTEDCTFKVSSTDTTGIACEAGDMAIYDGTKWNVVSGENQVEIVTTSGTTSGNKTTIALGEAKDVLTIEGKTLTLALDYKDLNDNHLDVEYGEEIYVNFEEATVGSKYIKLEQNQGTNLTISKDTIIKEATELKDGTVTFNETSLVNKVELPTLNAGKFPVYSKNSEKSLSVSGGSLTANTTGTDFVRNVTFGDVTFDIADSGDTNKITAVTNITSGEGSEFLNGIHITGEGETADLTITGHITPTKGMNTVFVEGLKDNSTTVVTSLTEGSFKLIDGSDIATGFGAESTSSGDVISSINVTTTNNASVLNEAKVENHVLSFGTTNVANGVNVEKKYKSLQKKGFEYKSATATTSEFVTSGFKSADDVKLTFGKAKETTYSFDTTSWKLVTPELGVDKGSYTINHTTMKATLPNGLFFSDISDAGTLPSFSNAGSVGKCTLTGSVDKKLTIVDKTIAEVKEDAKTITLPGAYSLVDGSQGDGVEVGKAGSILDSIGATVDLQSYVTNVTITE